MSTKYFIDTEFSERGPHHPLELISIGIVSSDGREYYAQSVEFDASKTNEWVKENVLNHLIHCGRTLQTPGDRDRDYHARQGGQCTFTEPARAITGLSGVKMADAWIIGAYAECPWRTREQIRDEIKVFCAPERYGKPELWTYFGSYDFVLFSQLFGTMVDLPKYFPMLAYDLRQWLDNNQLTDVRQPDDAPHHAIEDARWIAKTYKEFGVDTDFDTDS